MITFKNNTFVFEYPQSLIILKKAIDSILGSSKSDARRNFPAFGDPLRPSTSQHATASPLITQQMLREALSFASSKFITF